MISTSEQTALARRTILFVDDEPLSQKYFKASVGRYANVLTASNPDAALKMLAASGDTISVVVSDERMPHDSGVSFLTNVRKSWPSTVRILTSAYADIENLQQAINGAAIYRFVPKPWDFDELCSAMQEALVAERVAEKIAAPLEGRLGSGNAESANIELLAVLARELATPLGSLDKEAFQLSILTGTRGFAPHQASSSQIATGRRNCALAKSLHRRRRCSATFSTAGRWPDRLPNWRPAFAARRPRSRPRWRKRLVKLLSKSRCAGQIGKSSRSTPGRTSATGRRRKSSVSCWSTYCGPCFGSRPTGPRRRSPSCWPPKLTGTKCALPRATIRRTRSSVARSVALYGRLAENSSTQATEIRA